MSAKAIWLTASLTSPPSASSRCCRAHTGRAGEAAGQGQALRLQRRRQQQTQEHPQQARRPPLPAGTRRRTAAPGGGPHLAQVLRVHQAQDGVQAVVGGDPGVGEEGEGHGRGVGQARGLQQDGVVGRRAARGGAAAQRAQRVHNVVAQAAAHAAAVHADQVLLAQQVLHHCGAGVERGAGGGVGARAGGGGGQGSCCVPRRWPRWRPPPSRTQAVVDVDLADLQGQGRGAAWGRGGSAGGCSGVPQC